LLKMISIGDKKNNNVRFAEKFRAADTDGLPDFQNYDKPLEMGLWVLWVAKDKLHITRLTAQQVGDVLVDVMEVSVHQRTIVNAFNRARGKIHRDNEGGETYYTIMKPGKEHLIVSAGEGRIRAYYFEPGKRYYSKSCLANDILAGLADELRIVDPYCSVRTLDILAKAAVTRAKFLTRLENLPENKQKEFVRELTDFKSEHPDVEFKNYSNVDIHDRYIIASNAIVILGHSMKDLGTKESFAIILDKEANRNIFDALTENFNRRWKGATLV